MSASSVLGIDLGTSNTVVACVGDDGLPHAIASESGSTLIPSIVSVDDGGRVLVGDAAKARRFLDPKNTVFGAKRLMGRAFTDPELQQAMKRLPYELRRGKNETVRVLLRGELYTLPELGAFVVRKARAIAETKLGRKMDRAVITVPANFNDLQREAAKLAATLADLEVLRVLNEPTAAALAYGHGREKSEQICVYDFGGGTFDVTLLSLSKTAFRVRATAGDMFLGGDDVDALLADTIAQAFQKKHYFDARVHGEAYEKLRLAATTLKVLLSEEDRAEVVVDTLVRGVSFSFAMTRAELDALIEPLVARTLAVCERAFSRVRASPRDVGQVVLVGGSTRIPLVRRRVAELFGREPETGVDPDEAVALGAALEGVAAAARPRKRRSNRPPALRREESAPLPLLVPPRAPDVAPWPPRRAEPAEEPRFGWPRWVWILIAVPALALVVILGLWVVRMVQ